MASTAEPARAGPDRPPLVFEAKLRRPTLVGYQRRDRLYHRLDAGESPLVVIHADAGYGKTMLVASYLEERARRAVWYHVGSSDRVPGTFAAHIAYALASFSAPERHSELARIQSASDPEAVGALLARELDQLDSPLDLVLEDYHRAQAASEIHRVVLAMAEHLSARSRLYVLSRVRPNMPLPRLAMAGKVRVLAKDDLAFTEEETMALFAEHDRPLADEELSLIMLRLEGWAVGLRLTQEALTSTAAGSRQRFWSFFAESRALFDYLADEVLVALPAGTLDFLQKTSIFAVLRPELIEEYLPGCGASAALQALARQNLFTMALSGAGNEYRYHSLFRQLLVRQLRETRGEEEVRGMHARAADLFASRDEIGYAIGHSLAAGDYHRVARFHSRLAHLQRSDVLLDLMEGWVERAFPEIEGGCSAALMRLLPVSAYEAVLPGLCRLAETPKDAIDPVRQAHAQQRLGIYHFNRGHLDQCIIWLQRSRDIFRSKGHSVPASVSDTLLAFTYIMQGPLEQAETAVNEGMAFASSGGSFAMTNVLFAKAELALAHLRFADAEEAARSHEKAPSPKWNSFSLDSLSLALLYQGRGEEAEAIAREAVDRAQRVGASIEIGMAQTRLAAVLRVLGRLEEARASADSAVALSAGYDHWHARALLARAEIATAAGGPDAQRLWAETQRFWQERGYEMQPAYDGLIAPTLLNRPLPPRYLAPASAASTTVQTASESTTSKVPAATTASSDQHEGLVIQTFGTLRLRIKGRDSEPSCWARSSARRLFCYLLINRHRLVARDELLEAFWPEDDPDASSNRLWIAVHVLRREVAPLSHIVSRQGEGYRLRLPEDTLLDVDRFLSLTTIGVARGDLAALQEAVALYRGDFLAEYRYDDFIDPERTRLRDLNLRAIVLLAEMAEEKRDRGRALAWYGQAHQIDPTMVRPVQRIMELLSDAGEVASALEVYNRHCSHLKRALDFDPCEELRALHRRISGQSKAT